MIGRDGEVGGRIDHGRDWTRESHRELGHLRRDDRRRIFCEETFREKQRRRDNREKGVKTVLFLEGCFALMYFFFCQWYFGLAAVDLFLESL